MKRLKFRTIVVCLVSGFLTLGCVKPRELQIKHYALQKKLAELDDYNYQIYKVLKKRELNDAKLFYQQLRFNFRPSEKEVIDVYLIKGVDNLFSLYCYLQAESFEKFASLFNAELVSDIINAVSGDRVQARELSEFLNDKSGKYQINANERLKEDGPNALSYFLMIDEKYGGRLDINGSIRNDVDFYSFFALMENVYVKWNYEVQSCDYGVNYQVELSDEGHLEYGFYTQIHTDEDIGGDDRFTLDLSNQVTDEKTAFVNIDVSLFRELITLFSQIEITAAMLEDFFYDESGKYDDGDDYFPLAKTYIPYHDSDWNLSYFLSSHNSETLTYYGDIKR